MKLIIGISGATGAIFGIRLLEILRDAEDVETHLVMSNWAKTTIIEETNYSVAEVQSLADYQYSPKDLGAAISSGSFHIDGMIVAPCSMKSLASISIGLADNLITRAADVMLKESKKIVLMTRETPLNQIHLENMLKLSQMGVTIFPPMPAFYNHPKDLADMVDHIIYRLIAQFGIDQLPQEKVWTGFSNKAQHI
ncbi:UbiX family flavin prenyltransferase [Staphylococcus succinus]|jgi:4-hydroxy-3-polyprenylbenzoate decarboxylase|uniref:Flavin prenyltransferase UbiX n=1 Tax=Staphylococcus succinus TaxID=61015 RepID=A0A9Q6MWE9_9STAP|nr:UbiX family flavin prenyltransferase [Staphylococcus succinus]MEB8127443.1 UbiX family flavin prenyltransferase [Staphylococcus succinus]MEB8210281.1 UbiX family flavin prenyltransferase [Staphylococcus succinus]PTI44246.1 UbiX family flavin prenyltransferase [Staphylococcus succinus]PTI77637.1 UbiX family flavin prenyltransferase [Staphylococcus succinus]PTJ19370.1 UbiX family flavin prenyltransferase [Staphylococcus succinus]